MKTSIFVRAFLVVLLAGFAAKADSLTTWDFSFQSLDTNMQPDGQYVASGSFQTMSLADSVAAGVFLNNGLELVSLDGQLNGQQMTLVPGFGTAIDIAWLGEGVYSPFLDHALNFTVDGLPYYIHDNDTEGPPSGNNLAGPFGITSIALSLVDTPEPDTFILLGIGLLWLAIKKAHKRFATA